MTEELLKKCKPLDRHCRSGRSAGILECGQCSLLGFIAKISERAMHVRNDGGIDLGTWGQGLLIALVL